MCTQARTYRLEHRRVSSLGHTRAHMRKHTQEHTCRQARLSSYRNTCNHTGMWAPTDPHMHCVHLGTHTCILIS